ncbi:MAG TPA: hypothetical protein PLO37_23345 [Candidatus Hydrogenedentes bacterium]|nr:hypothetical protein [Candidatus Hydrogenedentota bacterium]HPG69796.1 hypothetical protein [Candidatus Hydrogenedentota bacterium]
MGRIARPWDRIHRALFVALAVGLGWGIRGDFGHLLGAMYPGAALGLGFAFVSGQRNAFRWMPLLGALGGLGISTGGAMSYGLLHGYAKADSFVNYSYGFFTLFLEGGAWGCFGGALIGLALERKRITATEFASMVITVLLVGAAGYGLVVGVLGFHINPERSDLTIGFTGGVAGLFLWLALSRYRYTLKGALFGYVGFGLGMSLGRLLANISYLQPLNVNHWNIMEVSCGLIGGFVYTYGMLGREFPKLPEEDGHSLLSVYGAFYVMAGIPLAHRIIRVPAAEKLDQWTKTLESYGYANASDLSARTMHALHVVCVFGVLGAVVWFCLHRRDKHRFAAFPILFFSLLMLLIQNLNALYLYYPRQPHTINMHTVFWILLGLMALYALFVKQRPLVETDDVCERVPWRRAVVGALAAYALIVIAASFVNGEETMRSACTRFPVWSWQDGPPPGAK